MEKKESKPLPLGFPGERIVIPRSKRETMCFVKRTRNGCLVKRFDVLTVYEGLCKGQVIDKVSRVTRTGETSIRIGFGGIVQPLLPFSRRGFVRQRNKMFSPALLGALAVLPGALPKAFTMRPEVDQCGNASTANGAECHGDGGDNRGFHRYHFKKSIKKTLPPAEYPDQFGFDWKATLAQRKVEIDRFAALQLTPLATADKPHEIDVADEPRRGRRGVLSWFQRVARLAVFKTAAKEIAPTHISAEWWNNAQAAMVRLFNEKER